MSPKLKDFLLRWVNTTVAVFAAAYIVPGIQYNSIGSLLVATLVLGVLNALVRPVLMLLSLPLLIFTLGLFTLVINAALLYWVSYIVKGFQVNSFKTALWGALVIAIVSLVLNSLTGTGNSRIHVRRGGPRPPSGPADGGNGPVIDV